MLDGIALGTVAPDFTLPDATRRGQPVVFKGNSGVVVFYPSPSPNCTAELVRSGRPGLVRPRTSRCWRSDRHGAVAQAWSWPMDKPSAAHCFWPHGSVAKAYDVFFDSRMGLRVPSCWTDGVIGSPRRRRAGEARYQAAWKLASRRCRPASG